MQLIHARACVLLAAAVLLLGGCSDTPTSPSGVSREQAITIARQHVPFEPTSVNAEVGDLQGRSVWVVTMRRADGSRGGLGQFGQVIIDRSSGVIVATAIS